MGVAHGRGQNSVFCESVDATELFEVLLAAMRVLETFHGYSAFC